MRNSRFIRLMIGLLLLPLVFSSCEDRMDEHYKIPDWLKGSAFAVLQSEGDYTIFLEGIEKSGFKPIVDGKSILTVMAPNDSAFNAYFKKKGISSISQLSNAELKKLIGFHILYYAFDWSKLVNFRPMEGDGATDEEKAYMAGYYFKFRTKSSDELSRGFDQSLNDSVWIYHLERFLPVFSYKLFQTKGIDAKYNYEYFYQGSKWTGGNNGFNVSNASVKNQNAVITDNGYLYYVDQVIDPLETIYTELKNRSSEYSEFLSLYDTYTKYVLDNELTSNFGNGKNLYLHGHGELPPIAYEWPVSSYSDIKPLSSSSYNIFAPSNSALNTFFNDFWKVGGYASISELDPLIKKYFLLQSFSAEQSPVFPEEISSGKILTTLGTQININPDDVNLRKVCANGFLYGIDKMTAPAIFSSIAGPAFKYADNINYLYALDRSELLLALASKESRFISLMPKVSQFTKDEIVLSTLTTGKVLQKFSDDVGTYVDMSKGELTNLVNMHLSNGSEELKASGTQVLETNVAFNYWFVNNGKITTNALFNQYLNPDFSGDPFVTFTELKNGANNWENGKAYTYEFDGLFKQDESDGLEYSIAICNDSRYQYYLFAQLLQKAGLINESQISFLMEGTRFIAFIPTNDAIKNNLSKIPGTTGLSVAANGSLNGTLSTTNKSKLANWLRSLFITSDLNSFTGYPYPGAGVKGSFDTYGVYKLSIIDDGAASPLKVKFTNGENEAIQVISKYFYLPFAFKDGCFHLVDEILL